MSRALFLDRDGVLNRSAKPHEYITRKEEFEFLPETFSTLRTLRDLGYEFYIITNQGGIARGKATKEQVDTLHDWMQERLEEEGIELKAIYLCPHQDQDNCMCRKPKPGLLLQAIAEHNLHPADIVFIGDRKVDEEAGLAAGVRTILIPPDVGLSAALPQLLEFARS